MEKTVTIEVVSHNNELLFKTEGITFDDLTAYPEFEHGTLDVIRQGGRVEDMLIKWYGTHGACVSFIGTRPAISLSPHLFQEGDTLILKIPCQQDFDFPDFLREKHFSSQTLLRVLQETPSGTLNEIRTKYRRQAEKDIKEYRKPDVLRFKSNG